MLALVLSGIPQGSVLGPIIFLVNDLQCHLKGSIAGSFADDTRLNKQISSCEDVLILQEDLNIVVKYLGVHLSPDIKWSLQATIAAQNANKMANWVLSVFSDRSKDVLLTLYKSIFRSRLEYSCPIGNPSSMLEIKKLESTQCAFTRYISGCQGLSYWDRLK